MAVEQHRGGWEGSTCRGLSWPEFDALPVAFKRLFWNAPYDYGSIGIVERWKRGEDVRGQTAATLAGFAADVRRESARLYGEAQEGWL